MVEQLRKFIRRHFIVSVIGECGVHPDNPPGPGWKKMAWRFEGAHLRLWPPPYCLRGFWLGRRDSDGDKVMYYPRLRGPMLPMRFARWVCNEKG